MQLKNPHLINIKSYSPLLSIGGDLCLLRITLPTSGDFVIAAININLKYFWIF